MLPQMTPYTPSLYQPDSYGRYRIYPRVTETPIPGAGYRVGQMYWGEQELNLEGSRQPQPYGSYSMVPLRGLGIDFSAISQMMVREGGAGSLVRRALDSGTIALPGGGGGEGAPLPTESVPEDYGYDVAAEIASASAEVERAVAEADADAAATEGQSFFERKVGPVPYWAIGLGVVAVVGGGGFLVWRKKRKPKRNRRRR
jgi:LPXTG-motif cell wall-anchored protein